jgi:hypothetical protein
MFLSNKRRFDDLEQPKAMPPALPDGIIIKVN